MDIRCDYCFKTYPEGEVCPHCGFKKGGPAKELFYLTPGAVIGERYIIGQVLGAGGFGIVYKAWDKISGVTVAIKEYYPSGLVSRIPGKNEIILIAKNRAEEFEAGKTRFTVECDGTAQLDEIFASNPGFLHGVRCFETNNTVYLAMELLDGITLTQYINERGIMPVADALSMIEAVLSVARDIHSIDVVHRDISPDNVIMCADGTVKLIDFGAARFGKRDTAAPVERVMKPGYTPPEQYEPNGNIGPHTDIYAIGATLYFALTGVKPDEATNRKTKDLLAEPQRLEPHIDKHVSNAVLKAMAIDYRLRFTDTDSFVKALRGEKKAMRPEQELKKRRLKRVSSLLAALIVLGAASVILLFSVRERIPTLDAAEIEIWYIETGDELADAAKMDKYTRIGDSFTVIYPDVTITVRAVADADYTDEITAALANGEPILFESDSLSGEVLRHAADMGSVAKEMRAEAYFLDRYSRYFSNEKQLPTGFVTSCVFINTALSSYQGDSVKDLSELLKTIPVERSVIAVGTGSEAAFETLFGKTPYSAQEEFFADSAGAIFADTSVLASVQGSFAGRYKLLSIDSKEIPTVFAGMYSAADCGRAEGAALMKLAEYLISENTQDILHIQTRSGILPLNKSALETYSIVFADFSGFFENIGDYVIN